MAAFKLTYKILCAQTESDVLICSKNIKTVNLTVLFSHFISFGVFHEKLDYNVSFCEIIPWLSFIFQQFIAE